MGIFGVIITFKGYFEAILVVLKTILLSLVNILRNTQKSFDRITLGTV